MKAIPCQNCGGQMLPASGNNARCTKCGYSACVNCGGNNEDGICDDCGRGEFIDHGTVTVTTDTLTQPCRHCGATQWEMRESDGDFGIFDCGKCGIPLGLSPF